jgi:hypothetical protein
MKKVIQYAFSLSLGLLILIGFEGIGSLGDAFKFEEYSIIGWITQSLAIIFTISASILLSNESNKE